MKTPLLVWGILMLTTTSCQKSIETISPITNTITVPMAQKPSDGFISYNILKGQQYCDKSTVVKVEYEELKFIVKFDSSAIYTTIDPMNQGDINKLFGFSDNNAQHHEFSARFGWNWDAKQGLCLHGYIYNNGLRSFKFLGAVSIGQEHRCSIKVMPGQYVFTLDGKVETMPRESTTTKAVGYRLFPYFGGDEMAPHDISIQIKEL